ncbi:MAG: AmmeMemoRadiSam system protein A [Candidatus Aenigmarchaeota archaeon]|nr:AmmeMemoRadiSam system protein A [Candidatus Aenigmarchaeota archaeon]OYT57865.1 MAG: AMMECR1 domain-containing protein [Candidatus Aenigmarchaeota archaeon ex4484_14]RLI96294.1 MAG: TIGR00296 family protein [Candidatus Aenigmarchaeota archaeon]
MLTEEQGEFLVKLARRIIESFVRNEKIEKPKNIKPFMNEKRGVFCTLTKNGKLRGCIGLPYPTHKLVDAVVEAAVGSTQDPRFPSVTEDELKDIKIEISVLTTPKKIDATGEEILEKIKPKEDGLIIKYGFNQGLFLPQVWEELPNKTEFLDHLCLKAGLAPGYWKKPGVEFYGFRVQAFKEK